MNLSATPTPDFNVDASLVYNLLAEQHPDLKHLKISLVDSGWDNTIFRLGEELCVRMPRRQVAATLIENEQIWLPLLANRLPIRVPNPYRFGFPGQGYPCKWSVIPWLTGVTADRQELERNQVEPFVNFLKSLHLPAPLNAPRNPVRGVPLFQRKAAVEVSMKRLQRKTNLITPEIEKMWERALNSPIDVGATWLHGDLHPRNILVENGQISGIIDWGDLTSGDLATDLASIWMLFSDRNFRQTAIAKYENISYHTLQRATGWAIFFGVILLDTGLVDNPQHALIGAKTLSSVREDLDFIHNYKD